MKRTPTADVALVTPWQPQTSGIADYAASLYDAMIFSDCSVDVFTNSHGAGVTPIESVEKAAVDLSAYSRVLFQVGNHPHFHGYMLPLIAAVGCRRCVVELHDLRLSHILAGLNYEMLPDFEKRWLSANYFGSVDRVSDAHPVSDLVCNLASDVIVHSEYAETRLRQLGVENVHVVDLAYDLTPFASSAPRSNNVVRIGVFGTFQPNRQIPLIISALGLLRRHGVEEWQLVLGGRRCEGFDEILQAIENASIADKVEIHDGLETDDFVRMMGGVDVHVALRNPTYGETSGVVVQAMALGIPTIVSDVGWYSELPGFVTKISQSRGLYELATALRRYVCDVNTRQEMASQTAKFARHAYDIKARAQEVISILKKEESK